MASDNSTAAIGQPTSVIPTWFLVTITRNPSPFAYWAIFPLVFLLCVSCARPPQLVGIDNPEIPVRSVAAATYQKIFIATTREDSEAVGALFSELRSDELGLASVNVSIPPTHEAGSVERPIQLPPDPRTEFAIIDPTVYETDAAFVTAINSELRSYAPADRDTLFFVHGFNMTTSDAILQVAQFVEDSGFKGAAVLFTWASAGKVQRYVYDMNSALIARQKLIDATEIVTRTIASDYHIFAHSMGGFLTMEAIVDAARSGELGRTGRLRHIILASPDIDFDLFKSQLDQIDTRLDDFYVLLSQDDYALRASRLIAGGVPRVGAADADALAALGVNVIDLSEITDERTDSHSKFSGSPEIVQLIGSGLTSTPEFGAAHSTELDKILGSLPIRVIPGGS